MHYGRTNKNESPQLSYSTAARAVRAGETQPPKYNLSLHAVSSGGFNALHGLRLTVVHEWRLTDRGRTTRRTT